MRRPFDGRFGRLIVALLRVLAAGWLLSSIAPMAATHGSGMASDAVPRAYLPVMMRFWPLGDIFAQAEDGDARTFINPPGALTAQLDAGCRRHGELGLHLTFAYTGPGNGGWVLSWDTAPTHKYDSARFTELSFWVKGTAPNGFQIGLKDSSEHEAKVEAKTHAQVSPDAWHEVRVPLSAFANGGVDLAALRNLNFGFNAKHGAGEICVQRHRLRLAARRDLPED